jgi:signal transduction histidine kinase
MEASMNDTSPGDDTDYANLETFAASVAHDFNNLLTGILGNLELMQNRARRSGDAQYDGYIEGAHNASQRAAIFAQRLLAFSGRATQDPVPVAITPMLTDIIEPLRSRGDTLDVTPQAAAARVLCDPVQAEIALHELLNNALDATGETGHVRIRAAAERGTLVIEIADNGPGMSAETRAQAEKPFFTTRPSSAGKGLGLPIAIRFAAKAGGDLILESLAGVGTTARLRLPIAPD